MDYNYCVCDLDGTLLNSRKRISKEDKDALRLLSHAGVNITVATGRSDLLIREYLHDLDIEVPVISCNGGLIRDYRTGKVLYMKLMPPELAKEIMDFCDRGKMDYLVYTPDAVYYSRDNKRMKNYEEYNKKAKVEFKVSAKCVEDEYKKAIAQNTIKILISDINPSCIGEFNDIFNKDNNLTIVSSDRDLIDIMASDTSKGKALTYLAELLDIDLKKTVVFGDNYNDISMFKVAGLGVAVGNAEDDLKKVAGYVTLSNEESGVSYAIHNHILKTSI